MYSVSDKRINSINHGESTQLRGNQIIYSNKFRLTYLSWFVRDAFCSNFINDNGAVATLATRLSITVAAYIITP